MLELMDSDIIEIRKCPQSAGQVPLEVLDSW